MRIVVLNGSPKGQTSVTMQYVHYLEKQLPAHTFEIVDVALKLPSLERQGAAFPDVIEQVRAADGVLWAFPLYYYLVHGNYKRFIELIWERGATEAFRGKHAAALSTSIHFYDHTAHNYIRAICDDLDMRFVGSFAAEMQDLFDEGKRAQLVRFGANLCDAIASDAPAAKAYLPIVRREFSYSPGLARSAVPTCGQRILVVTDAKPTQTNLLQMVERFRGGLVGDVDVVNLHDVDIKGGCLGCLECGYDNTCAYTGKDGFIEFYKTKVQTADILVYAGAIVDRYLSSTWKTFFDRSFFNTHTPVLGGKQFGFIVAGPLGQTSDLRQILEAYVELQGANLAGIVTDEQGDAGAIDALLQNLAANLVRDAQNGYVKPRTFLGVGGMRIFRDDVWGKLRIVFQADHRAYQRMGVYDFPQRDLKTRALNAVVGPLLRIPAIRRQFTPRIKEGMVQPFQKILRS